jgi:phospholipid/cholesterol/gamma-HCH transport system substrate-binding protein
MKRLALLLCVAALAGTTACSSSEGLTLVAEFRDVGDLVTRANVQSKDAVIGTISKIELRQEAEWLAHVTMELQPDVIAPRGTKAFVRSTSLLGEKFVDLVPPEGATRQTPNLPSGSVISADDTAKAPELEEVFSQLGAILASGALTDLARFINATAVVVEDRQDEIGRVFDGTAKLVSSLAAQRDAIAGAIDALGSSAETLAAGSGTAARFLTTSDDALRILADQRSQLEEAVVQLERLGTASGDLVRTHKADTDRSVKSLLKILPKLVEGRSALDAALGKLPSFAKLFAAAIPGDYVQLDVSLGLGPVVLAAPASASASASSTHTEGAGAGSGLSGLLWSATR